MEYIHNDTVIDMSFTVELVFTPILEQFKIDNEKYIETCKKRQEAGKKWGIAKAKQKVASASKRYQKQANSSYKDKVKDNDKVKDKDIIKVSKDSKEQAPTKKNPEIDKLIEELKTQADILWIAYDKKQERNFWNHIVNAKEFGNFCEKIWQGRIEFAKNIMIASEKIWFWKGACSWPMSIYQNYSEVYNLTKTKAQKKQAWQDVEIINIT